jgi:hypothetical protein
VSLLKTFLGAAALNAADNANQDAIAKRGEDMIRDQQARNQDALIGLQQQHIDSLEARANRPTGTNLRELELERKVKAQEDEIEELSAEVRMLKRLLSKPMLEIANESFEFKETYQKQQSLLANWITSQKAYRELAMRYGKELGKTDDAVAADSEEAKRAVIENKSELGNNVDPKVVADLNYEEEREERRLRAQAEREVELQMLREKYLLK